MLKNEALLLQATMCACIVYTSTTTRAHFNQFCIFELIVGSHRYPQHLQLLLLFHVLQTTVAAVSIFANQPLTNRAVRPFSSIVADLETLPMPPILSSFLHLATIILCCDGRYVVTLHKKTVHI
jgi:hypothetical protein